MYTSVQYVNARVYISSHANAIMPHALYCGSLLLSYGALNGKFPKDPSFHCRDIQKRILPFNSHQYLMYFAYFHGVSPPKATKVDNF